MLYKMFNVEPLYTLYCTHMADSIQTFTRLSESPFHEDMFTIQGNAVGMTSNVTNWRLDRDASKSCALGPNPL